MAKDPAFLFYPGDWHSGTMLLTRHQKGCYIDILIAQFNNGPLSFESIKTILGQDQATWTVLSSKFKQDSTGNYFNERLATEVVKRKAYSESRRKNKEGKSTHDPTYVKHMTPHMENENRNEIVNEINSLIQQNYESRFKSNELADYVKKWLLLLGIESQREFFVENAGQRNDRFDLMVFDRFGAESFIIEVKNYSQKDDYYKPLKQIARYSKHNLPILFVPNFRTCYECILQAKDYYFDHKTGNRFVFIPSEINKWNTKPGEKEIDLELPEIKSGAVIQQFKISKQTDANIDQVETLWAIFKAQHFTGDKFYQTKNDTFSHFINWSKSQTIENKNGINKQAIKSGKNAGTEELAGRLKEKLQSYSG